MSLLDVFRKQASLAGPDEAALECLRQLDDEEFFLRLCEALRRSGYTVDRHGMSSNGGDMVLRRRGERTWLRYRLRHARRVGLGPVRELYRFSQEQGAAGCKFVTCGVFDLRAVEFVRDKPIELLGGATLIKRMPTLLTPAVRDTVILPERSYVPRQTQPSKDGSSDGVEPERSLRVSPPPSDFSELPAGRSARNGDDRCVPLEFSSSAPGTSVAPELQRDATAQPHRGVAAAPVCPRCGSAMDLHVASAGNAAGNQFWACVRRPDCKGLRPA